jgi:DNA-binding winged helix-turn-helix (wHTH) protein
MRFTFAQFELDVDRRALLENGSPLHLSPKAFALLGILVDSCPRALSKEELTDKLWPDTFVEESNLAGLIAELRSSLGDQRKEPKFVRTVHGFGYAFCCAVAQTEGPKRAATLQFNGEEIPIYEGVNVLGRDPSAGVLIDHETVSRRHATLTVEPTSAVLEDLASKNGTFVGETRITERALLEDGATFVLGDARVVFRRAGAVRSTVTISRRA